MLHVTSLCALLLSVLQCSEIQQIPKATLLNNGARVWEALNIICDKGYGILREEPYVNVSCLPSQEYETNITDLECESKKI